MGVSINAWRIFFYVFILTSLSPQTYGKKGKSKESAPFDKMRERLKLLSPDLIGGSEAQKGQFPSQVSLRFVTKKAEIHFCGGTIISRDWVITAAYCVFWWTKKGRKAIESSEPDIPQAPTLCMLRVVAGEIELVPYEKVDQKNKRKVVQIISHDTLGVSVEKKRFKSNLALLQVDVSWTFTKFLKPLKPAFFPLKINITCQVAGWGFPTKNRKGERKLLYMDAMVHNYSICNKKVPENIDFSFDHETICAGKLEGHGPCLGVTGGGLICGSYLSGIEGGIPFIYRDSYLKKQTTTTTEAFNAVMDSVFGGTKPRSRRKRQAGEELSSTGSPEQSENTHVFETPGYPHDDFPDVIKTNASKTSSGHFECNTKNFPGIFTNVADFKRHIRIDMRQKRKPPKETASNSGKISLRISLCIGFTTLLTFKLLS